jgi:chromosome partitioning protein
MFKTIAVFNHKGDVSKTISLYHIAWKLTQLGKRVLLIDADPQCNLTSLVLGNEEEKYRTDYPERNIKDALKPAFTADTFAIKAIDCVQVKHNDKLYLLAGHLDLGEYEVQLAFAFLNAYGMMRSLPGAFHFLVSKTAEKYQADYVLIDMNPSLSAMNQDIILSSDYFIIPTTPHYFSDAAIKSLASILPKWEYWAKSAREDFGNAIYPMPMTTPKFLGYMVNDFNAQSNNTTENIQKNITNIDNRVHKQLVPKLAQVDMLMDSAKYEQNYCLGQLYNLGSLGLQSQAFGMPFFALSNEQIGFEGVSTEDIKNINSINTMFQSVAEQIINRLK